MKLLKGFFYLFIYFFLQKYQEGVEEKPRGSEFVFNNVGLLYYNLCNIRWNRDWSHIDSPEWLKIKKATINPKNNDGKCLHYALIDTLNYEKIKSHSERISKIKAFIEQYDWKEIFHHIKKTGKSLN